MVPRPKEVTPLSGYKLKVTFENGETRLFDMLPLLELPCYKRLKNPAIFNTVKPHDITLEWVTGEDICPDRLYNESSPITN